MKLAGLPNLAARVLLLKIIITFKSERLALPSEYPTSSEVRK